LKIFGNEENKVPIKEDVMMKCQCGSCPVQAESTCSRPKLEKMTQMRASMSSESKESSIMGMALAQSPMEKMDMEPKEMPGVYCSIGKAACDDLNMKKGCICGTCQVYEEYSLMKGNPVEHFCFNGNAT
jgi:ferredoxin